MLATACVVAVRLRFVSLVLQKMSVENVLWLQCTSVAFAMYEYHTWYDRCFASLLHMIVSSVYDQYLVRSILLLPIACTVNVVLVVAVVLA